MAETAERAFLTKGDLATRLAKRRRLVVMGSLIARIRKLLGFGKKS
jgi:hypothetical protein